MRRQTLITAAIRASVATATLWAALPPAPAAAAPRHVQHPSRHQEQRQIEQLEEQWRQAALSNDVVLMDKLLSEDYLGITANGELVTKAQQLDRMRTRDLTVKSLDVEDEKIRIVGQVAIVTSLAQVVGTNGGAPLEGSFRYTRVYQRLPSGIWKVTNFEVTHIPRFPARRRRALEETAPPSSEPATPSAPTTAAEPH